MWETSIRPHDITIEDGNGMFSKFFNCAMYRQKEDIEGFDNWVDEYELNDSAKEELTALRTAYGYLIHDHNTADVSKLVLFSLKMAFTCTSFSGKAHISKTTGFPVGVAISNSNPAFFK